MSSAGESELIRVTLVDYATGSTLLDSLVYPDVPMAHYNTRFTGIRAKDMRDASRSGKCIRGRDAARKAVWQFVGPDTIVVGHSGHNDLSTLRIIISGSWIRSFWSRCRSRCMARRIRWMCLRKSMA